MAPGSRGGGMGVVLLLLLTVSSMLLCDAFLLPFKASSSHKAPSCIAGVAPITGSSKPNTWLASTVGGGVEAGATERHDALIQQLLAAEDLPTLAFEQADQFDYHFMAHLMGRAQAATDQTEIDALNRVGEAVNFAMQQRLAKADFILRGILQSGDLKVMEAKMRKHLRGGELDMAFDVILNINAQQARADEGSEAAANILQHLSTILSEERDKKLPPETRLLRMLLRTKKQEERLGMLLEKLLLANPPPRPTRKDEETGEEVEEERFWGEPEVAPAALSKAIADFLEEVASFAQELDTDVIKRAEDVRDEVERVVAACS